MSDVEFLSDPEPLQPEIIPSQAVAPSSSRRTRWLASVGAVVVIAGGGAGTYVALAASDGGSATPTAAVQKVVTDFEHRDLVGMLDDLVPGERNALEPAFKSDIKNLQRLGVLSAKADPSAVSGLSVTATGLRYAQTAKISDAVRIVTINGGSVTIRGDASKLPLAPALLAMAPPAGRPQVTRYNLARQPVRIAAQEVGGRWYTSLFYTVANQAAHGRVPSAADAIAPHGASSAADAVRQLLVAALAQNERSAIALLSPAEAGALQTYAGMVLSKAAPSGWHGMKLLNLQLDATTLPGGYVRESLKSVAVKVPHGRVDVTVNGSCVTVNFPGQKQQKACASNIGALAARMTMPFQCARSIGSSSGWYASRPRTVVIPGSRHSLGTGATVGRTVGRTGYRALPKITPRTGPYSSKLRIVAGQSPVQACRSSMALPKGVSAALGRVFTALLHGGVEVQQVNGQWYVAPVRSIADDTALVLSALQPQDLSMFGFLGGH